MHLKSQPIVDCKSLSYSRSGKQILENISCSAFKSKILTVVGPNGGGKSTLAKLIIGSLTPTSGKVTKSKDVEIGYMPQRIHINELIPITAGKFLSLGIKELQSDTLNESIKMFGLENILNTQISNISGGELQKLLFVRILARDPDLLVLDEPTNALDINAQEQMYEMLEFLRSKRNKSIIIVSHHLFSVMKTSDHVICLNRHMCCEGEPAVIKQDKAYIEMFAPYTHRHTKC
jgi:zinc transport system ATP-binding protein